MSSKLRQTGLGSGHGSGFSDFSMGDQKALHAQTPIVLRWESLLTTSRYKVQQFHYPSFWGTVRRSRNMWGTVVAALPVSTRELTEECSSMEQFCLFIIP